MIRVQETLRLALAEVLEALAPGHGTLAAFEKPKLAAHGDLAITAAMQLARPLKQNPRQLAQTLQTQLQAHPAFAPWVDTIEIAGPGFLNLRLKASAKQEVVREVLTAAETLASAPPHNKTCWSNLSLPTRPAPCTSAMVAKPRWAMPSATCSPARATGFTASSITTMPASKSRPWPPASNAVPKA